MDFIVAKHPNQFIVKKANIRKPDRLQSKTMRRLGQKGTAENELSERKEEYIHSQESHDFNSTERTSLHIVITFNGLKVAMMVAMNQLQIRT